MGPHFLLKEILKVEILGHAQELSPFALDDIFQRLGELQKKIRDRALTGDQLYDLAFSASMFTTGLPASIQGEALAETVSMLFFAQWAEVDSRVGFELLQNLACCRLLLRFNQEGRYDQILEQLSQGSLQGVLSPLDPRGPLHSAEPIQYRQTADKISLQGSETVFFTPSARAKLILTLAQKPNRDWALALVYDQGLALQPLAEGSYFSPIQLGFSSACQVEEVAILQGEDIYEISGFRKYINLLYMVQSRLNYKRALGWAQSEQIYPSWRKTEQAQKRVPLSHHPRVADSLIGMMAICQGLESLFYHSVFYTDCLRHGASSQSRYFTDLNQIFDLIFKFYAPKLANRVAVGTRHILGARYFQQVDCDLLAQLELMGGSPLELSGQLILQTLQANGGIALQTLLKEFEQVDAHLAISEDLKETINIWRDFVGGLFLLHADLLEEGGEEKTWASAIYSEKIATLLGDVILAHLLIKEALAGEKELAKLEVSFFNLEQEAINRPEARPWYNKILLALYFTHMELSGQDAQIRMIQEAKLMPVELMLAESD